MTESENKKIDELMSAKADLDHLYSFLSEEYKRSLDTAAAAILHSIDEITSNG